MEQATQKFEVEVPELEDHQIPWDLDDKRFKVVVAGRRCGKTVFGKKAVIEGHGPDPDNPMYQGVLAKKRVWWVTRDNGTMNDIIWPALKDALAPITVYKNETQHRIVVYGGGEVVCKSMESTSLRGSGLDGMVLDESAFYKEGVWESELRPALSDRMGWAVFITTPNGGNWFYDLWESVPSREDHSRFSAPTSANPHIPESEIEQARATLHPLIFAQEYLAEFVIEKGDVFRKEWIRYFDVPDYSELEMLGIQDMGAEYSIVTSPDGKKRMVPFSEGTWFCTADLATSLEETADWTVIGVWQHTRRGELLCHYVERTRTEGPDIPGRLQAIMEEWGCTFAGVEETGHKEIVQQMVRDGLAIFAFKPGRGDDKRSRAIPAATRMMHGKVLIRANQPWTPALVNELLRFTGAKDGVDDQVDMLSYAERIRAIRLGGRPLVGGR